jgi:hypothetical protein
LASSAHRIERSHPNLPEYPNQSAGSKMKKKLDDRGDFADLMSPSGVATLRLRVPIQFADVDGEHRRLSSNTKVAPARDAGATL